jgi:glutaredoxin
MPSIVIYSKPGCSLCVEAREELDRVRREIPFELDEVDISPDPALMAQYGDYIPVVALDGSVVFEYFVDAKRLRELLRG